MTEKPIPGSSSSCLKGCSCVYCFGLDRNVVAVSSQPSPAVSTPKPKLSAVFIDLTLDDGKSTNHPTAERAMASVTSNSPLPPSVEAAYYRKCIELKRRINEIEASNDELRLRKVRTERAILKLRLERAFLLEHIEKRMKNNVDESDESDSPPPTVSAKSSTGKKRARSKSPPAKSVIPEGLDDGSGDLPEKKSSKPRSSRSRLERSRAPSPEPSPPIKRPRTSDYVSPYGYQAALEAAAAAAAAEQATMTYINQELTSHQPTDKPLRSKRGHRKATPPPASSAPTSQQPTPAHQNTMQPGVNTFASTTTTADLAASTTRPTSTTPSFLQTVGATQSFQSPLNGATTLPPLPPLTQIQQPYDPVAAEHGRAQGANEAAAPAMTNGPGAGEASSRVDDEAAAAASLAGLSRGDVNGPPAAGGDTEMHDAGAGDGGFGFTAVNR